jgi:hypothetical protein
METGGGSFPKFARAKEDRCGPNSHLAFFMTGGIL